jgi:hypothetical protein
MKFAPESSGGQLKFDIMQFLKDFLLDVSLFGMHLQQSPFGEDGLYLGQEQLAVLLMVSH